MEFPEETGDTFTKESPSDDAAPSAVVFWARLMANDINFLKVVLRGSMPRIHGMPALRGSRQASITSTRFSVNIGSFQSMAIPGIVGGTNLWPILNTRLSAPVSMTLYTL